MARFAGAHIYSAAGDVLYATPELLGVHTIARGRRIFQLRRPAEVVFDLFARRVASRNAAELETDLLPASTSLFYTGSAACLEELTGP